MSKDVILTGLRANSEFHIGNYLGGILPVVALQQKHAQDYQVNMFIPDLHSFTTPIDHWRLYKQTIDNLKVFVAAGLDIESPDTFIYRQSYVSAHSELAWILSCFTNFGELSRMTQFKDKSGRRDILDMLAEHVALIRKEIDAIGSTATTKDLAKLLDHNNKFLDDLVENEKFSNEVTAGLFVYPVLMAADILLYGAKYVPVGDDQKQHLELARDLAERMNNKFNQELFTIPEAWSKQLELSDLRNGIRIRSLRNPDKKMSKSIEDPSGTIMLSDSPEEAAKKVMRAETDSFGEIKFDFAERPGISNLLQILSLLTNESQEVINKEWEGKSSYGDLKAATATAVESFLKTFQAKLALVDETRLLKKLDEDEKTMNEVANATLYKVQKAVGLRA